MEQAGLSTTDSASMICANCDSYLCSSCGRIPVPEILIACGCDSEYDCYDPYEDRQPMLLDQINHGPDPQRRLTRLVHQIATATGSTHREVNARINREIGVPTRVGAGESVIREASAVAGAWWSRVENTTTATGRGPLSNGWAARAAVDLARTLWETRCHRPANSLQQELEQEIDTLTIGGGRTEREILIEAVNQISYLITQLVSRTGSEVEEILTDLDMTCTDRD